MSIQGRKRLPAKKNATCIVCEDARIEVSGKYVLVGVYPGATIRFHKDISKDSPGRLSLAFVFWFRDCCGEFKAKFELTDPTGEQMLEREIGNHVAKPEEVLSFVVGIHQLSFTTLGKHHILITLDDKEYEFPLTIDVKRDSS